MGASTLGPSRRQGTARSTSSSVRRASLRLRLSPRPRSAPTFWIFPCGSLRSCTRARWRRRL